MKKKSKQRPHITIIARRWFQRTYGNTYHSVTVLADGVEIGRIPFAYGYGEQYLQSAFEVLQGKGFYPHVRDGRHSSSDYSIFRQDMMDHRESFTVTCSDVGRQKDL